MGRHGRRIKDFEVQKLQNGKKSENAFQECKKLENHKHYINICDLQQRLPGIITNDPDFSEFITIMCSLTTMIQLSVGEDVRCGSSFVQKVEIVRNKPCPCAECERSAETRWGKVTLTTALHVLEKEADATRCEVRFFYDSDDSRDQKIIKGQKSHSRDEKGDWCALVCATHELDLLRDLDNMLKKYWTLGRSLKEKYGNSDCNVVVVVSHPHGGPKRVSVGKGKVMDKHKEVREEQNWCTYSYDAATCDGSSGGPVYVLGRWNDGFGYWFGHSHNHSGIDNYNFSSSTVGVDSTYGQVVEPFSYIDLEHSAMPSGNTTDGPVIDIIQCNSETNSTKTNHSNVCDANNNVSQSASSTIGVDYTNGQFVKPFSYIDLEHNAIPPGNTTNRPVIDSIQYNGETNSAKTNHSNVCDANNNVFSTKYTKEVINVHNKTGSMKSRE
ncbi:hypothetical protein BsWGS_22006 [Bradybaena similaris]